MAWDRTNGPIIRTDLMQPDPNGVKTLFNKAVIQAGVVPSARLVMSSQPSNNDTIGIGGTTFKFVTSLGAAAAQVQVKIGASAAATQASLVKAINGTTASAEWVEATTPFAVAVLADSVSTSVRIRAASARGGTALASASSSIALAESITAAADIWNCENLNKSGKDPSLSGQSAQAKFAVTAQMITNGSFDLELPFPIDCFSVAVTSSAGVLRSSNEAVTASGSTLHFVMAGGASPNLQAGDIVYVEAAA